MEEVRYEGGGGEIVDGRECSQEDCEFSTDLNQEPVELCELRSDRRWMEAVPDRVSSLMGE